MNKCGSYVFQCLSSHTVTGSWKLSPASAWLLPHTESHTVETTGVLKRSRGLYVEKKTINKKNLFFLKIVEGDRENIGTATWQSPCWQSPNRFQDAHATVKYLRSVMWWKLRGPGAIAHQCCGRFPCSIRLRIIVVLVVTVFDSYLENSPFVLQVLVETMVFRIRCHWMSANLVINGCLHVCAASVDVSQHRHVFGS